MSTDRRPTHITDALDPIIEGLRLRTKRHRDDNISGCCGASLVTDAAGYTSTRYRCSQCRRLERIA